MNHPKLIRKVHILIQETTCLKWPIYFPASTTDSPLAVTPAPAYRLSVITFTPVMPLNIQTADTKHALIMIMINRRVM